MGVQEYLSLGYIYLLAIGLLTDSVYYNYIGINILNYSNFLDILITPIKHMTSNLLLPAVLLLMVVFTYFWSKYIYAKTHKPTADKPVAKLTTEKWVYVFALMIFGLFLGLGVGMGSKLKAVIENGQAKPNHIITFTNGKQMKIKVIGQNSTYIFYVPEKEKEVIVSPIADNVFQIKKIKGA